MQPLLFGLPLCVFLSLEGMDGNFPHEVGSPFGYRRIYAVDDLDGAAVDIDRDEYPADCEQQSEPGRPYHRTEPVGRGDARLSAESRAEDAPACAEKIAERERAEYHDDERRPYRTVQEERPDAHDAPMAKTPNHLPTSAEPVIAPSLPAWLATLSTALQLSPSRRAAWSSLQVK